MIVGDIHGNFKYLEIITNSAKEHGAVAVIQVGDFGYYPHELKYLKACKFEIPVYFVDGNHEDFNLLNQFTDVTEVHTNVFYVPRGTVLNIDNKRIVFLGGASSVDKNIRLQYNMEWDERENIRKEDVQKLDTVFGTDILITHSPPESVVQRNFDNRNLIGYGVSKDWKDTNQEIVESLWSRLNYPTLYCGHMHRAVSDRSCRILDINEWILHP